MPIECFLLQKNWRSAASWDDGQMLVVLTGQSLEVPEQKLSIMWHDIEQQQLDAQTAN